MRADIFITNTCEKPMAVGMTVILPGKTKKILEKDFERKASYIDRMIKEGKLSFANPNLGVNTAPAEETTTASEDTGADDVTTDNSEGEGSQEDQQAGEQDTTSDSESNSEQYLTQTSEADSSEEATEDIPTGIEDVATETETEPTEETQEPEEVKSVAAPKRSKRNN